MEEILFWGIIIFCLIVVVCVFIVMFVELNQQFKMAKVTTVKVSCAGSAIVNAPNEIKVQNLNNQKFYDKNRRLINPDDYNKYWVKGWSMMLCGINDNDLVFTKEVSLDNISFKQPHVFVLKRDECVRRKVALDNDMAEYKVRRGWNIVCLGEDNLDECIKNIVESEKYRELKNKFSELFLSEEEMMEDFVNVRLNKYIEQYPNCHDKLDENHKAIISTTLKASKGNKVTFSLHPVRTIMGEVLYSYKMYD